jgi:hypothetical protein
MRQDAKFSLTKIAEIARNLLKPAKGCGNPGLVVRIVAESVR